MCEHQVETKIENGMVITYCKKCGQILDTKVTGQTTHQCGCFEGGLRDNGGQILHG